MIRYSIALILVTFFISCKSIKVNQEFQKTTTQNLQLGTVGEQKDFILEQDYNHVALPVYNIPIKVNVSPLSFNKSSYNAFVKAKPSQTQKVAVNYIDTLDAKPKYLKIDIADRVVVLNTLNSKTNQDVFQFLKNKDQAHVITSLTVVFNNNQLEVLSQADEVSLEVTGVKNYALKAYKDNILQQTILFNEGVVFAYKTSSCCWKQNDKYQIEIIDLAEGNNKCPNQSYKSANRAKKEINYFKL